MAGVVKEGDLTAGSEGYNPTTVSPGLSTGSAARVFYNNLGVVCLGDAFVVHSDGKSAHTPIAGASLSRVYVGPAKKEVFTQTTSMSPGCGDLMAVIPATVNAGS